jgi:hypothetical protein
VCLAIAGMAIKRPSSPGLEDTKKAADATVSLDLALFVLGKRTGAGLGREGPHAILVDPAKLNAQDAFGRGR